MLCIMITNYIFESLQQLTKYFPGHLSETFYSLNVIAEKCTQP